MKGMVFTEFLEMVESAHGYDVVDRIVEAAHLPSAGAYTAVGTYDHAEMWSLVSQLSHATGTRVPDLMQAFGRHLAERFAASHAAFFQAPGLFDFLASVDSLIHVEVRKLYPDAELPHFEVLERTPTRMVLVYRSPRHFGDLAEGLMRGSAEHYGEPVRITREPVAEPTGSHIRFILERE
jgi:hypothetical protein